MPVLCICMSTLYEHTQFAHSHIMYACSDQKQASSGLFYHSLPIPLKQGLSLNLGHVLS